MMKGQLDKTKVSMCGEATHNVAGMAPKPVKMKGQMDCSMKEPVNKMNGMSSSKVRMKGQLD